MISLVLLLGASYTGSKACATCHPAIYREYSHTAMGLSLALPNHILNSGWLEKPLEIVNPKNNRRYRIFRRAADVYQSAYELDENGKEVFRHTEKIEYVMGTGVNGATATVRRGNYLFQTPLSYYSAKKTWALSPNYEVEDLGFSFPITAGCITCHSGQPRPVAGREGLFEDPPLGELSIGCERCHGPGSRHVAHPAEQSSIVNPAKLPGWLADNICINCHEGDIRVLQPGKSELDFRPGTPLNQTTVILKAPLNPAARESPLLEHYYSMTLSRCYRESGGKLSCLTCHSPHAAENFRVKCLTCHTETSCALDLATRLRERPGDPCASCHMPKQPALTVSHSALTDHRILRRPGEPYPAIALKESLPGTGFIHVNAIPGESPAAIPPVILLRAYRQELIRGRLEFKDYYFSLLGRLLAAGETDPFALSAFAQKAASDGDLIAAIRYAREVVDRGSTSSYDYLLLAGLLAASGDTSASIEVLKKGLALAPYDYLLPERLAQRELETGSTAEALQTIARGLTIYPENSRLRELQKKAMADGAAH